MILIPPEMWENRSQTLPPPPVKKILNSKDRNYNKWTKVRMHQDPCLKREKQKREPIQIPIVETGGTQPNLKTKPKRKHIIGSLPLFKTGTIDSESQTNSLPVHSKYINNVLRCKLSHDTTFGVYQDILMVILK